MLGPTPRPNRRYRQIAQVLGRHGLGYLAGALGIDRFSPFRRNLFGNLPDTQPYTRPEHVRVALEELGPTFIKLGQILSTRADLLPVPYQMELAKLQDAAPPLPFEVVKRTVESELDRPLSEVFAEFVEVPLAAASIGQVHAARLLDGSEVAVKVQRPGVRQRIEEDLDVMERMAAQASRRWQIFHDYDVPALVQEFAVTIRAETDYLAEGQNAERFHYLFRDDPTVHVPLPFWDLTSERVLTLERIQGIKIDDLAALDAAAIDRRQVASNDARMVLRMIFRHGFFHADPHPGNFFVSQDGSIGLVDFGMVGRVDAHTQDQLVWALAAFTDDDPDRQVEALFDMGVARKGVDRQELRRDVRQMVHRYSGRPLGQIRSREAINDMLDVVRRHRLQLPSNLALLSKTVGMHEALVSRLDPEFDFTRMLLPYAKRMIQRQYLPRVFARSVSRAGLDAARLAVELPTQVRRLVGALERGDLEFAIRPTGLEGLIGRVERIANRLLLGVVAAAFLVSFAVLLAAYHLRPERGVVGVLVAAFVLAVLLGAYVAWSILRTGRP
jgi:ubiquinone biosynthesis protein